MDRNEVRVKGEIISEFDYSHQVFGERFYTFFLEIPRLSGNTDKIPVIISERLIDVKEDKVGKFVVIEGDLRSYNYHEGEFSSRLLIHIFVKDIWCCEEEDVYSVDNNEIILEGTICKPPTYRKTPKGYEISDLLLAVNSRYRKSNYIPAIAWGRDARYASCLPIGKKISLRGRFHSRVYTKNGENKIAYEVSSFILE